MINRIIKAFRRGVYCSLCVMSYNGWAKQNGGTGWVAQRGDGFMRYPVILEHAPHQKISSA